MPKLTTALPKLVPNQARTSYRVPLAKAIAGGTVINAIATTTPSAFYTADVKFPGPPHLALLADAIAQMFRDVLALSHTAAPPMLLCALTQTFHMTVV